MNSSLFDIKVLLCVKIRVGVPEIVSLIPTVVGQNFQPAQCGFHSE